MCLYNLLATWRRRKEEQKTKYYKVERGRLVRLKGREIKKAENSE